MRPRDFVRGLSADKPSSFLFPVLRGEKTGARGIKTIDKLGNSR
jgi:hypothetical protein